MDLEKKGIKQVESDDDLLVEAEEILNVDLDEEDLDPFASNSKIRRTIHEGNEDD